MHGRRDNSVGCLPIYWSLDKGYLVYLFSEAYLQHWNFVFSTAKQPWLHAYGTTEMLIRHFRGHKDKI